MKYRVLGKTGYRVSEISLGTWQVGGKWGDRFDEKNAELVINEAIDQGVNFIDTADVYGDRMSEKMVAKVVKSRSEDIKIATKSGRRLNPHTAEGYNIQNIRKFVEDSLANMQMDSLDLVQLHCPPTSVYQKDELFAGLDKLKEAGKIKHYGVSVEKVEEALLALEYPGVATIQVIFNMFRYKPAEQLFERAKAANVGILARVPLASGLLTGKMTQSTTFKPGDHRNFNRNGEAFDKGETFSGVDFNKGLQAVDELKMLLGTEQLAPYALKWTLMFDAVSCVIPGASKPSQAVVNANASDLPNFTDEQMSKIKGIYDRYFRPTVHAQW